MEDLTITGYIAKFRATKNISHLVKAAVLTLLQRRTGELLYGAHCGLFFRPSLVKNPDGDYPLAQILGEREFLTCDKLAFSRTRLIELWGEDFNVRFLPSDFGGVRSESIVQDEDGLIVGEYAERRARLAYATRESCFVSDYYDHVPGVRHIHSLLGYGNSGEILVATGDSRKVLDLWVAADRKLRFVKRIRTSLAGYTAAIEVNGDCYFGTDFSSRPNYIETLEGEKYFFPKKAYKMSAITFHSFAGRYIVALSGDMPQFGDRKTLSVFDATRREFIFCEYLDRILGEGV